MPLATLPFPAELGVLGPFTRESLTGEKDLAGPYKDQAEIVWVELLLRFWQAQADRVVERLMEAGKYPPAQKAATIQRDFFKELFSEDGRRLLAIIGPQFQKDAHQGAALLFKQLALMGVTMDWTLISTEAAAWARQYCGLLIKGINDTTRKAVGEAVATWIETPGLDYGDLRAALRDMAYPEYRAKLIARTEVTRAYSQGSMIVASNGEQWKPFPDARPLFRYFKVWQTKNDHLVCDACVQMHLKEVEGTRAEFMTPAGVVDAPPLHPGCRCWVTFRPEAITKEEAGRAHARRHRSKS